MQNTTKTRMYRQKNLGLGKIDSRAYHCISLLVVRLCICLILATRSQVNLPLRVIANTIKLFEFLRRYCRKTR